MWRPQEVAFGYNSGQNKLLNSLRNLRCFGLLAKLEQRILHPVSHPAVLINRMAVRRGRLRWVFSF
jgi:hypothetical protein